MDFKNWSPESVRRCLKYLLFELARISDRPSAELEQLLEEVIGELREEAETALRSKRHLRLVAAAEGSGSGPGG